MPATCASKRHGRQSFGAVSLHELEFIGAAELAHHGKRIPVSADCGREGVIAAMSGSSAYCDRIIPSPLDGAFSADGAARFPPGGSRLAYSAIVRINWVRSIGLVKWAC